MDLGLKDHVILISGGASGIGEAITRACLAEGAKVVVVSRVTPTVQPLLAEFKQHSLPCEFFEAELADPEACRAAVTFVQQKHGRLNGLVNNAGVNDGVGLASGDPARFMESLKLNLLHYYALAHYALPLLQASHGAIVNIASIAATCGIADRFAYSMTKGAVLSMTLSVAKDYIGHGIRCNCISPARVHTPFVDGYLAKNYPGREAEQMQALAHSQPIGRMGTPDEIATFALYLCSDAASFLTGCDYPIDGGFFNLR